MGAVHIDDIIICRNYAGAADHSSHCHMIQIDNISICRAAVTVSAPDGICTTRIYSHRIAACLAAGDAPGAAPVNNVRMRIRRPCLDKENSVAVRLSSVRLGTAAVDIHRCAAREDELIIVAVVPVCLICARSCRPAAVDIIVSAAQRDLVHACGVADPRASAVSKYLAVLRDHDRSRSPLIHITGTRRPRRENAESACRDSKRDKDCQSVHPISFSGHLHRLLCDSALHRTDPLIAARALMHIDCSF